MAFGERYATRDEYKRRTGMEIAQNDATIDEQLDAVSAYITRECGDRDFNKDTANTTRVYDTWGQRLLVIEDVVTIAEVAFDSAGDFTYATVVSGDVWPVPLNAPAKGLPYTALRYRPSASLGLAPYDRFPEGAAYVRVNGIHGWPEVPGMITEYTCLITRELRDLERSGFTLTISNLDAAINLAPAAMSMIKRIKSAYKRRMRVGGQF